MSYEQGAIWLCVIGGLVWAVWFFVWRKYGFHMKELKQIWDALTNERDIPKQEYAKFRPFPQYTPQGCKVWSTVAVPANALRNAEIGVENMLAQFKKAFPNYKNALSLKDYYFIFIDPMDYVTEGPDAGAPAIRPKGMKSAGTTIGTFAFSHAKHPYIVIAHQEKENWKFNDYLMRSVWYEAEHVIEYLNDNAEFNAHATIGDVHPHQFDPSVPVIPESQ